MTTPFVLYSPPAIGLDGARPAHLGVGQSP